MIKKPNNERTICIPCREVFALMIFLYDTRLLAQKLYPTLEYNEILLPRIYHYTDIFVEIELVAIVTSASLIDKP